MSEETLFNIEVDTRWWPLGSGSHEPEVIADALIGRLAPEVEGPVAIALRANLVSYAEWSQMLAPGQRRSFALVRSPELGRVDALLSFRYSATPGSAYDRYLELARQQESTDTVELVNQRVLEFAVPAGRVIAVHDVLVIRDGSMRAPARERCTAALFLKGQDRLVELHIATLDLLLFNDIVEYAVAMVSGDEPQVPGVLEYRGGTP